MKERGTYTYAAALENCAKELGGMWWIHAGAVEQYKIRWLITVTVTPNRRPEANTCSIPITLRSGALLAVRLSLCFPFLSLTFSTFAPFPLFPLRSWPVRSVLIIIACYRVDVYDVSHGSGMDISSFHAFS